MVKRISRPITDINWRDICSGRKVEVPEINLNLEEKVAKWKKEKLAEAREDWKVFIEWLGWVTI